MAVKPTPIWDRIADGVKIAVGILMATNISPVLARAISIGWLTSILGVLISVLIVVFFSERVLARPTLSATWYRKDSGGKDIPSPVLEWLGREKIKKFEVHLQLTAPSLMARWYLKHRLDSFAVVRIDAGATPLLEAVLESSPDIHKASIVDGRVQCTLTKTTDKLHQGWVTFSWERSGVQPLARQERPVRVKIGTNSVDRRWVTRIDSSVTSLTLDR